MPAKQFWNERMFRINVTTAIEWQHNEQISCQSLWNTNYGQWKSGKGHQNTHLTIIASKDEYVYISGLADFANSWYLVSIWQCIGRDFSQLKIINRWGTQIKYSGSTQIYFSGRCVQERRRQPVMARILMCAITISNDIYVGACSWTYKMLPVLVWFSLLEFIHHHAELVSQGLECLKIRS